MYERRHIEYHNRELMYMINTWTNAPPATDLSFGDILIGATNETIEITKRMKLNIIIA